ncbi:MAG: hypothetical protein WBG61_03465, partial [Desulfobacterales bacterium]
MTDETLNLHILRTKLNRPAVDGKWVQSKHHRHRLCGNRRAVKVHRGLGPAYGRISTMKTFSQTAILFFAFLIFSAADGTCA